MLASQRRTGLAACGSNGSSGTPAGCRPPIGHLADGCGEVHLLAWPLSFPSWQGSLSSQALCGVSTGFNIVGSGGASPFK